MRKPYRVTPAARPVLSLLLLLASSGCARAQESTPELPDAAERHANAIPVREVARSGVDTLFHQVTALDVDSRGRVYVGDWFTARVAVLDTAARLVQTIGRRGLGPGEFRSIGAVQVLRGDSVLAYDPSAARLSVFAPGEASPAYVTNVGAAVGSPPMRIRRTHANDAYLAMFRPAFRGDDTARAKEQLRVLELDARPRGAPVRVYPARGFLRVGDRNNFAVMPDPFGREGLHALGADDRLHFLWTDSLAVETTDLRGGDTAAFAVRYQAPRVERADVEAEAARIPEQMASVFRRALEDSLPEQLPVARRILTDESGRLWIGLHTPAGTPGEWAVFTPAGRYLASVLLPRETDLHAVRATRLYTVAKDANDVPHVVIYQMEAEPGRAARS